MGEHVDVQVTIQVEYLAGQLVRGRPLGPWRLQSIGSSWNEVRKTLQRRLQKALPDTLPAHLFEGSLPASCERWETLLELPPQARSAAWESPVPVGLQSFRWRLPDGQCVVRIPAVNCTLFGKHEDLPADEVARQARVALLRMAENKHLLSLRERLLDRQYDFVSLHFSLPIGGDTERRGQDRKQQRRKTATLRATATELSSIECGPVYEMDERVRDLAETLRGETPHSVLIVGAAGVGKTSLVHRLSNLRHELDLQDRSIWTTSGARIVSGMSGLGMWQQRCAKLIRQAHEMKAIIHFNSLLEVLEAGRIDGQPGVASMIRQSIARGRLLCIAECTPEQLAVIEREDPMLLRGFIRFELKEPGHDVVGQILRQAADEPAEQGQVQFTQQAIEELVRLHARFASYSAMPATPLRLMRTIREEFAASGTVQAEDVARAFAKQTGLPNFLVDDSVSLELDSIQQSLAAQVIGQPEPVQTVVNLVATMKARLARPGRPLASLLFIGPTGVGKTEMAKAIARMLYNDAGRMIRIDMSEYASPWSLVKLIGKPGEGDGSLTSPIREQPFSVVLLDEFEKADAQVLDVLLQLLGEGRLTDARGRLADFRNAVVIMTSNLGTDTFRSNNFGFGDGDNAAWREHFEREVRRFVRPEFLGRLDRIIPFQPLSRPDVRLIAVRELELLKRRTGLKYSDSQLTFAEAAIDLLCVRGYQPQYGARPLRRAIEQLVTVPLADALSGLARDSSWDLHVDVQGPSLRVVATRGSAKSRSDKEREYQTIDGWQELGSMARSSLTCGPLRDLENELERNRLRFRTIAQQLKAEAGPSRIHSLKEQLQMGETQLATARRLINNLNSAVEDIQRKQLQLMVAWHQNNAIDWTAYETDLAVMKGKLRQAVENVLLGQLQDANQTTIVVAGKPGPYLQAMWQAYRQLAQKNGWSTASFKLTKYHSQGEPEFPELSTSVATKNLADESSTEPILPILVQAGEADRLRRVADALPQLDSSEPELSSAAALGFAMTFQGPGVAGWLSDEYGIVHFFDAMLTGNRRRTRYRVDVFSDPLADIRLPNNWPEPSGWPERDPRKSISLNNQEVVGTHGLTSTYSQGKLADALLQMLMLEHEQRLWLSIGFSGMPADACLSS